MNCVFMNNMILCPSNLEKHIYYTVCDAKTKILVFITLGVKTEVCYSVIKMTSALLTISAIFLCYIGYKNGNLSNDEEGRLHVGLCFGVPVYCTG